METYAREQVAAEQWEVAQTIHVPGCYEIPLAARHAMQSNVIDAVIVLGWIERGKTLHGEVMGHVVHHALISLEHEFDKPIGIGIIGPGATKLQAWQRVKDVSRGAVSAAIQMKKILRPIK